MEKHVSDLRHKIQKLNIEEINYRYDKEEEMMNAISRGDYALYQEIIQLKDAPKGFDVRVRHLSTDNLRDRKTGMSTRKTLMRIAARRGGVPPIYLHVLAEKFTILIEEADSVEYLDNVLSHEMAKAFCEAVTEFSSSIYSETVRQSVLYIDSHLQEELSVNGIATELHVHPTYLSRKFKQETGYNMTEYINTQRINYAMLLFHRGMTSITDVALSCGYSSSSYFSKVFKKISGEFPSEYVKRISKKHDLLDEE